MRAGECVGKGRCSWAERGQGRKRELKTAMKRLAAVLFVVVTGIGLEVSVAAQSFEGGNGSGKETSFDAIAASIDDGPVIDGQVLEAPIWVTIAPVTGFT